MRVGFDQQIFLLQEYGGISRYICCLAQHLMRLPDVDARIVAPLHFNRHLSAIGDGLSSGFRIPRISKACRPMALASRLLANRSLACYQPDILHESYFSAQSFLPTGAKRVVTVYDMIHEKFSKTIEHSHLTSAPKRVATARADHIVCISENTKRDLVSLFNVPEEKISVTYLGHSDMPISEALAGTSVRDSGLLLYVGRRGNYKNFDGVLRAYAQTPQLRDHTRIVCFGGGVFSAEEIQRIRSFGLNLQQVRQVGGGDDVLALLYRQAMAMVYPSLYEGFGIPPLEAMAFDCPVICSNTSSIPEVVGDAGVYFNPSDCESIANAILAVAESSSLRAKLVLGGQVQRQRFSWRKCAEDTLSIYRKLM